MLLASTTALAYQMMIEEKFMSAMINAEQRGAYYIAAMYATIHAKFLGIDNIPAKPYGHKSHDEFIDQWLKHYFELLEVIGKQAKDTLKDVRLRYNNKGIGLPKTVK